MSYAWFAMSGLWIYQAFHFQNRNCLIIAAACMINGLVFRALSAKLTKTEKDES